MNTSTLQVKPVKENLTTKVANTTAIKLPPPIYIYDAIMSSGKTTDAIARMKYYLSIGQKFIFVTPFLDEIIRVRTDVGMDNIETPISNTVYAGEEFALDVNGFLDLDVVTRKKFDSYNKSEHFLKLVNQGKNIATTHALYTSLSAENKHIFYDYILIIDEAVSPVTAFKIGLRDQQILHNESLIETCDRTSKVLYYDNTYTDDSFKSVLNFCNQDNVFVQGKALISYFPIELFIAFKEVQVLTYMFEASIMSSYFKMHDIEYSIRKNPSEKAMKENFKKNLNIYRGNKNQDDSKFDTYLSKNSIKKMSKRQRKSLVDNAINVLRYDFESDSTVNAFTTFKEFHEEMAGKTFKNGFIAINARATNDYAHIKSMVYIGNRYLTPEIKNFFIDKGTPINEDKWALSELIQWIWRGCIRYNQPMNLYLPSTRMRTLLLEWLES